MTNLVEMPQYSSCVHAFWLVCCQPGGMEIGAWRSSW